MRQRVVLHVGLPKCGSTSLQLLLRRNERRLIEHGMFYPPDATRPDRPADFIPLGHSGIVRRLGRRGGLAPSDGPSLDDVCAHFARSPLSTMILSSESIVMRAAAYPREAWQALTPFDVEIAVFVRRRDDWLRSFYKQLVKRPPALYARSFGAFIDDPSRRVRAAFDLQIADALRRLRRMTGANKVRVFDLDRPGVRTEDAFAAVIGVPIGEWTADPDLGAGRPERQARGPIVNQSISDAAALFLVRLNARPDARGAFSYDEHEAIITACLLADAAGALPRADVMTPALSAALLDGGRHDRARLRRHFAAELTIPRPHAASGLPDALSSEDMGAIADAVIERLPPDLRDRFGAACAAA